MAVARLSAPSSTLGEALAWARQRLAEAGIEEAGLEGEVLLRHALGLDRAELYANLGRAITAAQWARLRRLVRRRSSREPLAYILGRWEFYGLEFRVTPAVLVPRPETELLAEEALRWASRRFSPATPLAIADVGTGSACIAVALAAGLPQAAIYATDTSPQALRVAWGNVQRHGLTGRVRCLMGDLLMPVPRPVDLIVANLPYVPEGEVPQLQPEIAQHEPCAALSGGPDGMVLLRRLLAQAPAWLRPRGALMLEMDPRQHRALEEHARGCFPGATVHMVRDLAALPRVLVVETP
ncbi:MAG: peptide chain release factor N(5)-glutamine methyltransferase [Chloroflexi bacterium]|nr:peptide chain release factor N(5)-glutamine methyltransferase [Chloroflexota bacterium]